MERAYYHCPHCSDSRFPFDETSGLEGRYSPAVKPLIALAGALAPFRQAADDLLGRFAALTVSPSSCRRVTEQAGRALLDQQQQGAAFCPPAPQPWDLRLADEFGRRLPEQVLYLGVDAFAVRTRTHGGLTTEFRMQYVGLLYDPVKNHTVYACAYDLDTLVGVLRSYAVALGLVKDGQALVVAISDGGQGLEQAVRGSFSDAVQFVLDYYHAAQYLHALAKALWGEGSAEATQWVQSAKTTLWEQGGVALSEQLRTLTLPEGLSEEGRETHRRALDHVGGNEHRLDYPRYREKCWDVGSGPTEAGCKILKGRLGGTGMRWLVGGSAEVGALRALHASGEGLWDAFFNPRQRQAA